MVKKEQKGVKQVESKLKSYLDDALKRLNSLHNKFKVFEQRKMHFHNVTLKESVKRWLSNYYEYCQEDLFNGVSYEDFGDGVLEEESIFFKKIQLLKGNWPLRIGSRALNRLKQLEAESLPMVFSYLLALVDGQFSCPQFKHHQDKSPFTVNFKLSVGKNLNFVGRILVEKVPVFQKKLHRISRFQYSHVIYLYDLVKDEKISLININKVWQKMKKSLDSARSQQITEQLIENCQGRKPYQINYCAFKVFENEIGITTTFNVGVKSLPNKFKPLYLSTKLAESFVYDAEQRRWLTKESLQLIERKKLHQYQQMINKEMLEKYADFSSAKRLVELLVKIPNFGLSLTEEEKDVIGMDGNVLVIGRSGTGKTTCSVLRLFSMEMLFKIRKGLSRQQNKHLVKGIEFDPDQLDDIGQLRCIFATASPVLTNEIKRYYGKLKNCIKQQIARKQEQKRLERDLSGISQEKHSSVFETIKDESQMSMQVIEEVSMVAPQPEPKAEQKLDIREEEGEQLFQEDGEAREQHLGALSELTSEDFPGFYTIRSLVMMIDGSLQKPFFSRNRNNETIGKTKLANWHNQQKGVMLIDDYHRKLEGEEEALPETVEEQYDYTNEQELEHQYQRQLYLLEQKKKGELKSQGKDKHAFEVDYDYFARHFFPQARKFHIAKVTDHLCWTEIYSVIKGSVESHQFRGGYLPEKVYLQKTKVVLNNQEKLAVYEIFCQYERWKAKIQAYDFIDLVNYILGQIRFGRYNSITLHYLQIDEIQDLPHAVVYLLCKVVEQGVFFSGDTAQTIAKGVNFRFSDLRELFANEDLEFKVRTPTIKQLTVNFRSHNNILQLANSLISLIEQFFPKTIDRLRKERSNLIGPKPILVDDADTQVLFMLLNEEGKAKEEELPQAMGAKPKLEFGCDQVIIVRDQAAKEKIPKMLQHALCLTIYEAKGLQFEDVILYNFFSSCPVSDKWGILKHLTITEEEVDKTVFLQSVSKQTELEVELGLMGVREVGDKVVLKKVKADYGSNFKDYSQICAELKLLYTAVTRPRSTLLIFDDTPLKRKAMETYWDELGLVNRISLSSLLTDSSPHQFSSLQQRIFRVRKTSREAWKAQGLKMFRRKYFQQAIKCFQNAEDQRLMAKAAAYLQAEEASKAYLEVQTQRSAMQNRTQQYGSLKKVELAMRKKQLKLLQAQSIAKFKEAGGIFQRHGFLLQSARCYYSAREMGLAKVLFERVGKWREVGECLYEMQKYSQAAEFFLKVNDYQSAVDCFEQDRNWEGIFEVVERLDKIIPESERNRLIQKYAPLFLAEQIKIIRFENEPQIPEPSVTIRQPIPQEQSDEDSEEEDDPELQAQKQIKRKESESSVELASRSRKESEDLREDEEPKRLRKMSEGSVLIRQQSELSKEEQEQKYKITQLQEEQQQYELVDSSAAQEFEVVSVESKKQEGSQASFIDIDKENNFGEIDISQVQSLSDVDDEWIAGSIRGERLSQYSVIAGEDKGQTRGMIIRTQGNIYAQDAVMRRVWKVVSCFRKELQLQLQNLRSKASLLHLGKEVVLPEQELQLDFQNVDPQLLALLLDSLQYFSVFKLCIYICNRYCLPTQMRRYIISIAVSYSPLAYDRPQLTASLVSPNFHRKSFVDKGCLGSLAIHSVFENVNPSYLTTSQLMDQYMTNGMILLGYYRKLVGLIANPFPLLYNFFQHYKYKEISAVNDSRLLADKAVLPGFAFFGFAEPQKPADQDLMKVVLEQTYWKVGQHHQINTIARFYLNNNPVQLVQPLEVPLYLKASHILLSFVQKKITSLEGFCEHVNLVLADKAAKGVQVFDVVCASIHLVYFAKKHVGILNCLLANKQVALFLLNLRNLFLLINVESGRRQVLQAVLSCYRIHLPSEYYFGIDLALVHRSSILVSESLSTGSLGGYHTFFNFIQQDLNVLCAPTELLLSKLSQRLERDLVWFHNVLREAVLGNIINSEVSCLQQDYKESQLILLALFGIIRKTKEFKKSSFTYKNLLIPMEQVPKILQEEALLLAQSMLKAKDDGRALSVFGLSLHYKQAGQRNRDLIPHFTGLEYIKFGRVEDAFYNLIDTLPTLEYNYRLELLQQLVVLLTVANSAKLGIKTLSMPRRYLKYFKTEEVDHTELSGELVWDGEIADMAKPIKEGLEYWIELARNAEECSNRADVVIFEYLFENFPQFKEEATALLEHIRFPPEELDNRTIKYILDGKQPWEEEINLHTQFSEDKYLMTLKTVKRNVVKESEVDYDRILVRSGLRIIAAGKIKRAWKKYRLRLKESKIIAETVSRPNILNRLRVFTGMSWRKMPQQMFSLYQRIEKLTLEGMQMYFTKAIVNSIDFHFILSRLQQYHSLRRQLDKLQVVMAKENSLGVVQLEGRNAELEQIGEELEQCNEAVRAWDVDQKWKKEVNLQHKKKILELKWLNKGLLAKRKGKKKEEFLTQKRQRLKPK